MKFYALNGVTDHLANSRQKADFLFVDGSPSPDPQCTDGLMLSDHRHTSNPMETRKPARIGGLTIGDHIIADVGFSRGNHMPTDTGALGCTHAHHLNPRAVGPGSHDLIADRIDHFQTSTSR